MKSMFPNPISFIVEIVNNVEDTVVAVGELTRAFDLDAARRSQCNNPAINLADQALDTLGLSSKAVMERHIARSGARGKINPYQSHLRPRQ